MELALKWQQPCADCWSNFAHQHRLFAAGCAQNRNEPDSV